MNKRIAGILCLLLIAAGSTSSAGQRTPQDLLKSRKADSAAGAAFLDAQVLRNSTDGLLQILALRKGAPRQGTRIQSLGRAGETLGLWHAYQAPDKSWVSNGMVYDVAASEGVPGAGKSAAFRMSGNPRLAAAGDGSGRLHVVILDPSGGNLLYIVRDGDSAWRARTSQSLPGGLSEMSLLSPAGGKGVSLLGLTQSGSGGSRMTAYDFSTSGGISADQDVFPEPLRATAFATASSERTHVFLLQMAGGEFRAVDRDAATGKWNLDLQKFMRDFRDPFGGAALRSLFGFMDASGLPQVVGLLGGEGVVHIYRDEIGTWYNNGVALRIGGLRRISGCVDAQGLINVIGLTDDGRIWHGFRTGSQEWRDNGLIVF